MHVILMSTTPAAAAAEPALPARLRRVIILLAAIVFVVVSCGAAMTRRPWSDEGWFANAAYELAERGVMGTTALEPAGTKLSGIREHTYWILPLYPVGQALWYKLFGFSLFAARGFSTAWGLVLLASWYLIILRLTQDANAALGALLLIAIDYHVIVNASFARYDMMSAASGFAGVAAYLLLRTRRLDWAVAASQVLIAASLFSHFLGVLHLAGCAMLALLLDRRRLRLRHAFLAAAPHVLAGAAWGLYILQSPRDFLDQFSSNATTGGRLQALTSPWKGLKDEVIKRYLVAYGLGGHSAGHRGPVWLKSIVLAAYAGALWFACVPAQARRSHAFRILLGGAAMYFVIMTLLDGQKLSYYLVHITPIFAALLALSLHRLLRLRVIRPWAAGSVYAALFLLQVGGIAYRMKLNTYAPYAQAANFLRQQAPPAATVMASAEMGFEIGFDRLIDDTRLGFHSGKTPDLIVLEEVYDLNIALYQKHEPQLAAFIARRLSEEYIQVYRSDAYRIYRRKPARHPSGAQTL